MAQKTYREWLRVSRRENVVGELEAYLAEDARAEGWTSEFKAAAQNADYGVREAIAALANTGGGEVFVGVDDRGKVSGSDVTQEALNETLRQKRAIPAPWRVTDLLQVTGNTTEIALPGERSWAYVIEVRAYDRPAFALDDGGRLVLPVRSGSDTKTLDAATSIEWHALRRRADVLRGCYRELVTFGFQISQHRSLPDGLPDPLPYIQSIVEDGTAYYILDAADRAAIFGAGVEGGRAGGAVDTYYRAVRRIRQTLANRPAPARNQAVRDILGLQSEFPNLEAEMKASIEGLARHISSQGFTVN